jgi:hypothetical protein
VHGPKGSHKGSPCTCRAIGTFAGTIASRIKYEEIWALPWLKITANDQGVGNPLIGQRKEWNQMAFAP